MVLPLFWRRRVVAPGIFALVLLAGSLPMAAIDLQIRLSASSSSFSEPSGTVTVTITRPPDTDLNTSVLVSLSYSGTATKGNVFSGDYTSPSSRTLSSGSTTTTFTVRARTDELIEGNETVTIRAYASGWIQSDSLTLTLQDQNPRLGLSISPGQVDEPSGNDTVSATARVSIPSGAPVAASSVSVSLSTSATYVTAGSGTIAAGSRSTTISLTVANNDDVSQNGNHSVRFTASASGYRTSYIRTLRVRDNDYTPPPPPPPPRGITLSAGTLTLAEGVSGSYTARLATAPTGDVTVSISSGDTGAVTVSPAQLSFSTTDYATAQTVTVTAVDDGDADNESVTLTHSPSGADYDSVADRTVTVTVDDDDTPGVTLSVSTLELVEEESGTYTVRLATEPSSAVTVSISNGDTGAVTVSPVQLSFSTTDYATAQTVTVTAVDDGDVNNESVLLTHSASGGGYDSVPARTVTVTVDDRDIPGVTLSVSTLTIPEGVSGSYTVRLETTPTGDVTVSITSGDTGAVTVSPAQLSFSTTDYATAQTVTVTALDDRDGNNESVTLTHSPSGGDYDSVPARTVTVTVDDDETPGITLSVSTLALTEGESGTYTVRLDTQPSSAVTVSITSRDTGAVTVSPAQLSFSTTDYATAQTVTVTALDDADGNNESVTLTHSPSGGDYDSVPARRMTITVDDDETPGVTLSVSTLALTEGESGTYTVRLDTQPTGAVRIEIQSQGDADITVRPARLTIAPGAWNRAQTVTVTALDDDDADNESVLLTHSASGGGYKGIVMAAVTVTVADDDAPGVTLSVSTLALAEGESRTYTVRLDTQPSSAVTVSITSRDTGAVTVSPAQLSFSTTDYATAQTVMVTALDDADGNNESVTLTHSPSGGDYDSVPARTVTVTVTDDDAGGVTLSVSTLALAEGESATYTVRLDTQPSSAVTVSITSRDTGAVTVSPAQLSFSTTDYATAQTVTVTAVDDADADNESVLLTHSASGGGYRDIVMAAVTVTVADDDAPGVTLSVSTLEIPEGESRTYTVRLDTQPTGAVRIEIQSQGDADITVRPARLTIAPGAWNRAQTVTVSVREDPDLLNGTARVSHIASSTDPAYSGPMAGELLVTEIDNDDETPGVTLSVSALALTEGVSGSYTVRLDAQPSSTVTVSITSGDTGAVTVSPAQLSFSTTDYATAQTVTGHGSG